MQIMEIGCRICGVRKLFMILSEPFKYLPLIFCGIFYAVLCIFSIVTGLMYASGKKQLNPLELSDSFVKKLDTEEKMTKFAVKMGWVTFWVGIVQGLTSFSIFKAGSPVLWAVAFGFNLFSIASVLFKLKGKINAFPLMKLCFYVIILIILLLPAYRALYF